MIKRRKLLSVILALCMVFGSYSKAPTAYATEAEDTTVAVETAAELESVLETIAETIAASLDEVTTAGVADYVDPIEEEQTEAPVLPEEKEETAQAPETPAPADTVTGEDAVEETVEPEAEEAEPAADEAEEVTETEAPKAEEPEDTEAEEPEEPKAEEPEAEEPKAEEPEETKAEEPEAEEPEETKAEEPEETKAEEPAAQTVYTKAIAQATVTVIANADAFDEEVQLVVKPLEAASEGYKDAEAAMAAEGKTYDGMMAFDIGFVSAATGEEVEPNSPVSVKLMVNKAALADLNANKIDTDSMTVAHITDDAVVDVADAADETDGQVTVIADEAEMKSIKAEFEVDGFSTYVITWTEDEEEKSATIHWGSYNATGEFEEFDSTTTVDVSATSVDLNVNVDGYYFVGVDYLAKGAEEPTHLEKESVLKKDGDTFKIGDTVIADGSDIYVNYASKGDGSYTPPPKPTGDVLAPETDKTVTDNGDGTFTIQLDIEGKQDQQVTQVGANVIIVMDITQSMTNNMPGGGTRMDAAKNALEVLINTLDPDTNLINFTAVNFGNSANYSNGVSWTTSKTTMLNYVDGLAGTDLGTCWQAGLQGGIDRVGTAPEGNETYVLFVTDGNPNGWVNAQGRYQQQGSGQFVQAAYNAAVPNANTLAGMCHLYGIFCGDADGYDHLEELITNANGEDVINGRTTSAIEEAFAQIAQTIVDNLGAGNTSVDDGIPTLSNVSAAVADGEAGGFEYYITEPGQEMKEWEDAPGASYDKTNGVTWDLGEVGVLPNGTVYTLKFTVWPSQAAYDLIADLNNGLIELSDLTEEQRASIDGNKESGYTLKTNTHLYTTFTDLDGNEYRQENDASAKAMKLPTETIGVKKIWNNFLDQQNPPDGVSLILTKDGVNYLSGDNAIEVSSNTGWEKDDIYISLGQIKVTDDGYEVLEPGHDYEIVEPENYEGDYRWELTSEVYHPMVINGTTTMLIKDESASGTEGTDYFVIDGTKYKKAAGEGNTLKAWNDRRSWLQIEKTVTGTGAPEDALFEFTVTINDANEEDIWYSAYGPDGIIKDLETSGTAETGSTGYYSAPSGEAITVKIQAGWTLRFLNLPSGTTYTIDETGFPDGFAFNKATGETVVDTDADQDDPEDPTISGSTVTGTINVPNVEFYAKYENKYEELDLEFTKEWDDEDDQDGLRIAAEDFAEYLSLLVNGEASEDYVPEIEDNEDGTYTITYEGVPKYIDGEEAEYQLEEAAIDGYETEGSPADVGDTITNTHEPETVDITAEKIWDDNDNQDGKRADVTFDLYADDEKVEGQSKTIAKDAETLTVTWEKLPKNADGDPITYSVKEAGETEGKITMNEAEYKVTYGGDAESGFTVTNKHVPEKITITVTKIWEDESDQDGKRPESVTFTVTGSDGKTYEATLEGEGDTWTADVEVEKYAGGQEVTFEVDEEEVADYDKEIDNETLTITNSYEPETDTITVKKVWDDASDQDGKRPESVTFTVTGSDGNEYEVTLSGEGDEWTADVEVQKYFDGGQEVTFEVDEEEVADYDKEIDNENLTITNSYEPETEEIEVKKVWDDASDQDGKRPESVTFTVTGSDGKEYEVTLEGEGDEWTATVEVDKYYNGGQEVTFEVDEEEVADYDKEIDNETLTITNSYEPETDEIEVKKVWDDASDQDGKRPENVKFTVTGSDGNEYEVTLSGEGDEWTATVEVAKYWNHGEEVTFEVDEEEVADYEKEIDNETLTITNSYEPETDEIEVKKVWDDASDQDGKRPENVKFTVTGSDGNEYEVTLSGEGDEWTATVEVAKYWNHGEEVTFEVDEEEVADYEKEIDNETLTITNSYEPETDEIEVKKVWDDASDQDGKRPENVKFTVTGSDGNEYEVTLSGEGDEWTATVEVAKYFNHGEEVTFEVDEEEVADYEKEIDNETLTITNTHEVIKTTVKVTKVWEDNDNKYELRPESIEVQLMANGEACGDPVELNGDNDWAYTWDVDAYAEGEEIEYTVEETTELPAGYNMEVGEVEGDIENGFEVEITNTFSFEPIDTDPPVGKAIEGDEPDEDQTFKFTFKATSSDPEPPMPEKTEVTITGEGETEFGQFWFTEPGTYEYEIAEVIEDAKGYTYDETVYKLKYEITIGENNELVKTMYLDGEEVEEFTSDMILFTNTFTQDVKPVKEVVTVKKIVKVLHDKPAKAETFEFKLAAKDGGPMPSSAKDGVLKIKGDGSTQMTFKFEEAGTYTYTLKEINTKAKNYTYDKTEYELVFEVKEVDGELKATLSINGTKTKTAVVSFTNKYDETPKTGDDTNMTPWIVAMATSAAVAGTGVVVLKKRRKEEEDA